MPVGFNLRHVVDVKVSEMYSAGDWFNSIWHAPAEKYFNQNKTKKWAISPSEKKEGYICNSIFCNDIFM